MSVDSDMKKNHRKTLQNGNQRNGTADACWTWLLDLGYWSNQSFAGFIEQKYYLCSTSSQMECARIHDYPPPPSKNRILLCFSWHDVMEVKLAWPRVILKLQSVPAQSDTQLEEQNSPARCKAPWNLQFHKEVPGQGTPHSQTDDAERRWDWLSGFVKAAKSEPAWFGNTVRVSFLIW